MIGQVQDPQSSTQIKIAVAPAVVSIQSDFSHAECVWKKEFKKKKRGGGGEKKKKKKKKNQHQHRRMIASCLFPCFLHCQITPRHY